MDSKNILIIEDHKDLADILNIHLSDMRCHTDHATDGADGLQLALSHPYDLIILDLMLPSMDGMEICKRLRQQHIYTPILMLTAKSDEFDRVLGLEVGADDYMTKPFSIRELIARVKAIFRRLELFNHSSISDSSHSQFGELKIDKERRQVFIKQKSIDLTAKEFDLLCQFTHHPGRVYTRAELLDLVWGYQHDGYEHTVNSHINRLRGKLESDPSTPEYILTVWGVGYKFNESLMH